MIKQISITFDFNTETDEVTNVKTVGSTEKKVRTTTKKLKDVIEEMASEAIITLDPNKLIFNNKAVADLELEYEDRVVIEWKKVGKSKTLVPTIRKDEEAGNKVTKSNTVVCKGKANTVLSERGTEFTIIPFGDIDGLWQLVSTTGGAIEDATTLEDAIEEAEETEVDLIVDTDETDEIDELKFKL
jgi:SHS2 domain-containing protein